MWKVIGLGNGNEIPQSLRWHPPPQEQRDQEGCSGTLDSCPHRHQEPSACRSWMASSLWSWPPPSGLCDQGGRQEVGMCQSIPPAGTG